MKSKNKAINARKEKNRKIRIKKKIAESNGKRLNKLDEKTIATMSKLYGLTAKTESVELGMFSLISKMDCWRVERDEYYYTLYHKENNFSTIGNGEHVQDIFFDLDYLMKSIVEHDNYKINFYEKEA